MRKVCQIKFTSKCREYYNITYIITNTITKSWKQFHYFHMVWILNLVMALLWNSYLDILKHEVMLFYLMFWLTIHKPYNFS